MNPDKYAFLTLIITSISLGITIIIKPIYRRLSGWRQAKHIRGIAHYRLSILSGDTLPESTNHSDIQQELHSALKGMVFDLEAALTDYSSNLSHNKKGDVRRLCNNIDRVILPKVHSKIFSPKVDRSIESSRNLVAKEFREIKWIRPKWLDTPQP